MVCEPGTSLRDDEVRALAGELLRAFETGAALEPLTGARPALSVDDAYAVQRTLVAAHARAGRAVCGRKIGLTSPAIQDQLGIDSPDFGVLLDSHTFATGATVSLGELRAIAPRIEPELAFVLARELSGPGVTAQDVRDATAAVRPVLEIIDSRIRDWRIALPDTVADNASCLGAVLGAPVPGEQAGDLAQAQAQLRRDGAVVARGAGTAVLGHPAAAVAWLANELARFGEPLPAGQPVLAGSFTAAVDLLPGRYEASFGPALGSVAVTVTA